MSAPVPAAWLDQLQRTAPRKLLVKVRSVPPCNVEQRFEYEGLFNSTFDAYDDALKRFPFAQRIEALPVPGKACAVDALAARSAA